MAGDQGMAGGTVAAENIAAATSAQAAFGQPAPVMATAPVASTQTVGAHTVGAQTVASPFATSPAAAFPVTAPVTAVSVTAPPTAPLAAYPVAPLGAPPAAQQPEAAPLPAAGEPAQASTTGPLTSLPPVSRPEQPPHAGLTAAGALSRLTGAVRGRRAARKPRLAMSAIFADLVDMADIPRSAYAVDEEVTGAMCLFKTDCGYEVFSCAEDARHEVRFFEEEEAAYFYLFGVLAAEALRNGRLSPRRGCPFRLWPFRLWPFRLWAGHAAGPRTPTGGISAGARERGIDWPPPRRAIRHQRRSGFRPPGKRRRRPRGGERTVALMPAVRLQLNSRRG